MPETKSPISPDCLMMAEVFKALGHPVRIHILKSLLTGERCVSEIQQNSGRNLSTISSHLNLLKNLNLIQADQRGKNIFYSLACPCLVQIFSCVQNSPYLNSSLPNPSNPSGNPQQ